MRTAHTQVTILFQALTGSALKAAVFNRIYTYQQPTTPDLDSVVINALPVDSSQFQQGTANVNIYVPNQVVLIGEQQISMPATIRLDELTNLALVPLEELYTSKYKFEITNISGPIKEPETNQHYINLRIDFEFFPDS